MAPRKRNTRRSQSLRRRRSRRPRSAQQKSRLRRPRRTVVRQLQPILETKKFCGYKNGAVPGPQPIYLDVTNTGKIEVNDAFVMMQGESANTVIPSSSVSGNDLFSRFLATKVKLEYPTNDNAPHGKQVRPVELVWGWARPLAYTGLTSPTMQAVSREQILLNIKAQISEDFNSEVDDMLFNNKRVRHYTIIGRKKLWPNNNKAVFQNTWDVGEVAQQGGPPPIMTTITWPMKKKVEYSASSNTGTGGSAEPFIYPNQAYIPWFLFYNPDYASYEENSGTDISQITVTTNSCHWFNDA